MKNFDIFIWASDYEDFTGEGLLARCFVENYFLDSNLKIKIISNNGYYFYNKNKISISKRKKYKNNIITKYLYLFYGVVLIWYHHIRGKKVCYLNYLPLWNFLIFILIPKKTILGPITGSVYSQNIYSLSTFIRKIFFPIFHIISLNIIFLKFKNIIFSTDNLKSIVKEDKRKFCLFNFCFLFFNKRKVKKKEIDFLFYIRKHPLKSNDFHKLIIKELVNKGLKVIVVGDKFSYLNVINYVNIPRSKLLNILDKTKYTVASDENFYSLFTIDCLSSNVSIFYNYTKYSKSIISSFIPIKFNNFNYSFDKIISHIKKKSNKNLRSNTDSVRLFYDKKELIKNRLNQFSN